MCVCVCVCVCVCISSSSCRAASTDSRVPLLPFVSTVHHFISIIQVFLCPYRVLAGCPTLAHPYEGVHGITFLISSSLLLLQCPDYLVCLIWTVFKMGGRWPYSCCFVGCCLQERLPWLSLKQHTHTRTHTHIHTHTRTHTHTHIYIY